MRRKISTRGRSPIFEVGGRLFADLVAYHELPVIFDTAVLANALARMPPENYVIGLRLTPAEARLVRRDRLLADEERFAQLRTLTDHIRAKLGIVPR